MREIVAAIAAKHKDNGIDVNAQATLADIALFERQARIKLSADFVAFYTTCNGFGCNEDIFNMISLTDITDDPHNYGTNWFYFAEYMIYSDTWGLRLNADNQYEIFNGHYPDLVLTSALEEFLNHFLAGNVFESGGLYDWLNQLLPKDNPII